MIDISSNIGVGMCGLLTFKGKSISEERLKRGLSQIAHRGPDDMKFHVISGVSVGFVRLSIVDLSQDGNQPFSSPDGAVNLLCNGEIYNHKVLKKEFSEAYSFRSQSDCEVIIPLIKEYGLKGSLQKLDGEYAFIIVNDKGEVCGARDPMGIRPLFYGYTQQEGEIAFASEAKALDFCTVVKPFPPGHYYKDGKFYGFWDYGRVAEKQMNMAAALVGIRSHLEQAVVKRLDADAELGFLLSGGLDSSLVCAIAAKHSDKPIRTFAIGTESDAIDLKYAERVATYIGAEHTSVTFNKSDVMRVLPKVIKSLESWDITTIRASVGMYLVCEYIHKHTEIKALLTGEVSDELFGYKYTDFAPSDEEFQAESVKRVRELYLYDVLRADRCLAAHSLEARVPFSDFSFVNHVMSIPSSLKRNSYGVGKFLLRKAFDDGITLPKDILFREKAAFSDAVGHSHVDNLKLIAQQWVLSKPEEYQAVLGLGVCPPTAEAAYYLFVFMTEFGESRINLISDYWMPNKSWENCDVDDPSARVLSNYGKSGH